MITITIMTETKYDPHDIGTMFEEVRRAHTRVCGAAHTTPLLTSSTINKMMSSGGSGGGGGGSEGDGLTRVYFKMESLQRVGAFKFRGAFNHISTLTAEERQCGVTTHSSGNHAQGLALAAKMLDVPAVIVMPRTSPQVKIEATRGYGAEVVLCEPTLQAREEACKKIIDTRGSVLVHPYDNYRVIFGAGTACLEMISQAPEKLDVIIAPVGGGGLLSGTCIAARGLLGRDVKIIAAEPQGASDAFRSFYSPEKQHILSVNPSTICDGLLTSVGIRNMGIIRAHVDEIVLLSDEEVLNAMSLMLKRMKVVVEPSGAIVLAAALKLSDQLRGKRVGLIVSGGNVDPSLLAKL